MNHHHRKTLHALFSHPVSSNLDPRHVYAALQEVGADVSRGGHGQIVVKLNGHVHGFHDTRHSLSKEEVGAAPEIPDHRGGRSGARLAALTAPGTGLAGARPAAH